MAYYVNPTAGTPIVVPTSYSSFTAVDLSSVVGNKAVLVHCKISTADGYGKVVALRPTGNVGDQVTQRYVYGCAYGRVSTAVDAVSAVRLWTCTDANGSIDVKGGPVSSNPWYIYVMGWIEADVVDIEGDDTPLVVNLPENPDWSSSQALPGLSGRTLALAQIETAGLVVSSLFARPSDETEDVWMSLASANPNGPAVVARSLQYDDGPAQILVPTGTDGGIELKRSFSSEAIVNCRTIAYMDTYIASGAELFNLATGPSSWTTLDCTEDAGGSPTGVRGKCLVYLKARLGTTLSSEAMVSVRSSDDPLDGYYSPDVDGRDTSPHGCAGIIVDDEDKCYLCVETNELGEIQWITDVDTTVSLELVGYVPAARAPEVNGYYHQNPTAYTDPVYTGSPAHDVWYGLDLSSIIGSQCAVVVLKLWDDNQQRLHFRPGTNETDFDNGSSNNGYGCACGTPADTGSHACRVAVCTDESGTIDLKRVAGFGELSIWLVGWMDATQVDVKAERSPVDDFTVVQTDWSDADLSLDVGARRVLAAVEMNRYDDNLPTREFYFRPSDETEEIITDIGSNWLAHGPNCWEANTEGSAGGDRVQILCPTGPDGIIQGKRGWNVTGNVKAWVHGYIKGYIPSGATIFSMGAPPTSWTELSTGVGRRAFAFLKIRRESGAGQAGDAIAVAARSPEDSSSYLATGGGPRGIGIAYVGTGPVDQQGDVQYLCVETNGSGVIEWRSYTYYGGDHDIEVDLLGYVISELEVSEFRSLLELGDAPTPEGYAVEAELRLGDVIPPDGSHLPIAINKAWHAPTAQWVRWETPYPDSSGLEYPGPGAFIECTDYRLEVVAFEPVE